MNRDTDEILAHLTEPQLAAVTHGEGPLLVVAGAGSGKTRVVTCRIAYLLTCGVWPSQILAMTFTNKAAREMRERVSSLVHGEAPRNIGTFHGCCARFLRHEIERLHDGRDSNYTIYDTGEQQALLKQALKEHGLSLPDGLSAGTLSEWISQAKGERVPMSTWVEGTDISSPELVVKAAALYEERLRQCNAVDFDDLLLLMVRILEEFPAVRDIFHNRFRYLLIDEYQDTNHVQYELMKLLTGPLRNVHVTGDPDQSIYSWRGADYSNIMNFETDFPGAKVVKLEQNYRSTKSILAAANQVIVHNTNRMEKNLFTENPTGVPIFDVMVQTDFQEGEWVARRIKKLHREGEAYGGMAVFYRTNSQSRSLEDALIEHSVPYQLLGGVKFYERMEVKDLLSFLRLRVNPSDLLSLGRVAKCLGMGVGPKTLGVLEMRAEERSLPVLSYLVSPEFETSYGRVGARLKQFSDWCRELVSLPDFPVGDCVGKILEHSRLIEHYSKELDHEDRQENLRELVAKAAQFEENNPEGRLADYLEEVSLVADIDSYDTEADYVTLMTLHSSKGLEFSQVFIAGVEEGFLPHSNSMDDQADLEEERRLFYVGITRAHRELVLLHAVTRRVWNEVLLREPSRFLREISPDNVRRISYGRSSRW